MQIWRSTEQLHRDARQPWRLARSGEPEPLDRRAAGGSGRRNRWTIWRLRRRTTWRNEAERNFMMEKARGAIVLLPPEQRQNTGDGIFRRADALRDSRDDGRPAGHGEDENTKCAHDAQKGLSGMIPVKQIDPDDLPLYAMTASALQPRWKS